MKKKQSHPFRRYMIVLALSLLPLFVVSCATLEIGLEHTARDAVAEAPLEILVTRDVNAQALQPAHVTNATLGDHIQLLGYDFRLAGQTLYIVLYWQTKEPVDKSYSVFVHVLDSRGDLRAQKDSTPVDGNYPTSSWSPGETIIDTHALPLPPDVAPGTCRVAVGMYDVAKNVRLPVVDGSGQPLARGQVVLDLEARQVTRTPLPTYTAPPAMTPTPVPADGDLVPPAPGPTPVPARDYPAPAGLRIAFVRDGQLLLWTAATRDAQVLASTDQTNGRVWISDDGKLVAFLRGNDLWVVDSDGSRERMLLSMETLDALQPSDHGLSINHMAWVPGSHSLAFNTRLNLPFGLVPSDDLHLLDADSGQLSTLLAPGQGGEFVYAPDGSQIAIVTPGAISLVDAHGQGREWVLTYTPVNTGSEYPFYARPAWSPDGRALRVAIPPADPFAQPADPTAIWHIAADGTPARRLAGVDTAPFLTSDLPAFSPDLRFVAYPRPQPQAVIPEQGEPWLEIQRLANGDRQSYPYASDRFRWAPDSKHFALVAGRHQPRLYIGQWSGETVPSTGSDVFALRWVDARHYLYVARSHARHSIAWRGWDLLLADIDGSNTILASMNSFPHLDFVFAAPHRHLKDLP